ncbi:uncharacterized protein [Euphorbia lathyris]|uniref:uncharacterized protein isoform X2 n=1 Tax=Euphorbia lathyris TaxID=212925 RepID=UPI00331322D2
MASHLISLPPVFFLLLLTLPWTHAGLILEEGYTVTTVIDGHKRQINPHAVLSRPGSSDLIVLDSFRSVFSTLQFPISQESVVHRLSGNGVAGMSDGSLDSAQFNKPKNFAVDAKGNIYVADRINGRYGSIRKITNSGVTTIAGGYSRSTGNQDGPAQNATFSSDFEVAFVPQECALLISDHGNQLVRHIGLKPDDCATSSQSGLGMVSFWFLGLGLIFSCLLGIAIGFVIRAYITPSEGCIPLGSNGTWKLCLINAVKPVLMFCFDMRSAVASSRLYDLLRRLLMLSLSHMSLMLIRINPVGSQTSNKGLDTRVSSKDIVSLLDSDVNSYEMEKSQQYPDLNDLITCNAPLQLSNPEDEIFNQGEEDQMLDYHCKIDDMIQSNIMGFTEVAKESSRQTVGLVKRR